VATAVRRRQLAPTRSCRSISRTSICPTKRARVSSEGRATEWVFWQTGAALLLPATPWVDVPPATPGWTYHRPGVPGRIASRRQAVPTVDRCPLTGRARLSYRRAAELFSEATKGWTLHQLRHSALTHSAEDGTNTPILLARSRHASVRSLERYARPSPEAVARTLLNMTQLVVVANGQPAEWV